MSDISSLKQIIDNLYAEKRRLENLLFKAQKKSMKIEAEKIEEELKLIMASYVIHNEKYNDLRLANFFVDQEATEKEEEERAKAKEREIEEEKKRRLEEEEEKALKEFLDDLEKRLNIAITRKDFSELFESTALPVSRYTLAIQSKIVKILRWQQKQQITLRALQQKAAGYALDKREAAKNIQSALDRLGPQYSAEQLKSIIEEYDDSDDEDDKTFSDSDDDMPRAVADNSGLMPEGYAWEEPAVYLARLRERSVSGSTRTYNNLQALSKQIDALHTLTRDLSVRYKKETKELASRYEGQLADLKRTIKIKENTFEELKVLIEQLTVKKKIEDDEKKTQGTTNLVTQRMVEQLKQLTNEVQKYRDNAEQAKLRQNEAELKYRNEEIKSLKINRELSEVKQEMIEKMKKLTNEVTEYRSNEEKAKLKQNEAEMTKRNEQDQIVNVTRELNLAKKENIELLRDMEKRTTIMKGKEKKRKDKIEDLKNTNFSLENRLQELNEELAKSKEGKDDTLTRNQARIIKLKEKTIEDLQKKLKENEAAQEWEEKSLLLQMEVETLLREKDETLVTLKKALSDLNVAKQERDKSDKILKTLRATKEELKNEVEELTEANKKIQEQLVEMTRHNENTTRDLNYTVQLNEIKVKEMTEDLKKSEQEKELTRLALEEERDKLTILRERVNQLADKEHEVNQLTQLLQELTETTKKLIEDKNNEHALEINEISIRSNNDINILKAAHDIELSDVRREVTEPLIALYNEANSGRIKLIEKSAFYEQENLQLNRALKKIKEEWDTELFFQSKESYKKGWDESRLKDVSEVECQTEATTGPTSENHGDGLSEKEWENIIDKYQIWLDDNSEDFAKEDQLIEEGVIRPKKGAKTRLETYLAKALPKDILIDWSKESHYDRFVKPANRGGSIISFMNDVSGIRTLKGEYVVKTQLLEAHMESKKLELEEREKRCMEKELDTHEKLLQTMAMNMRREEVKDKIQSHPELGDVEQFKSLLEEIDTWPSECFVEGKKKFFSYELSQWKNVYDSTFVGYKNKFYNVNINSLTKEQAQILFRFLVKLNLITGSKSHIWYGNELNRRHNKLDYTKTYMDNFSLKGRTSYLVERAQKTFFDWYGENAADAYLDLQLNLETNGACAYKILLKTIGSTYNGRNLGLGVISR